MEFNHSKHNLCMIREICYDSLTVSCSPLCLYSRLLSINKPDGFDTVMFSVCTFITTWLCNHNLSFPFTPFSCYHHPSYKLVQYSYMPTLTSECHLSSNPARTTLKRFKRLLFHLPMAAETGVCQYSFQQSTTKQLLALSKS